MTPIFKRKQIVVEYTAPKENKTASGIFTDPTTEPTYQTKEVIFAGEKCEDYKVGDIIYFNRKVGEQIEIADKKYILIPDEGLIYCQLK